MFVSAVHLMGVFTMYNCVYYHIVLAQHLGMDLRLSPVNGLEGKVGKFLQCTADQHNRNNLNKTKIRSSGCFQFPSVDLDEISPI